MAYLQPDGQTSFTSEVSALHLMEALEFFIHRGDATGSEESVKLSLSLMGLNDTDVESEFVDGTCR